MSNYRPILVSDRFNTDFSLLQSKPLERIHDAGEMKLKSILGVDLSFFLVALVGLSFR